MSGTVDVPKVGPVKKGPLFAIVGAGAAYVGWRWYRGQQDAAAAAADQTGTDGEFGDQGTIPAVSGGYTGQNVGIPDTTNPPASDSYGFNGHTNSQWTQYAATQLSMDGKQDYNALLIVLGQYLAGKPLTTSQQQTVQAAIAAAGYPPEGQHPIIPGGDTAITIAPTGLAGTALSSTSVRLTWHGVAGAAGYRIYRSGVSQPVGEAAGTTGEVGGLSPGVTYTFQVAAHTGSGQIGPKSGTATVKTKTVTPAPPDRLWTRDVTTTAAVVLWDAKSGVDHYEVYRGSSRVAVTKGTYLSDHGLRRGTRYTYSVVSVGPGGAASRHSRPITITTRK